MCVPVLSVASVCARVCGVRLRACVVQCQVRTQMDMNLQIKNKNKYVQYSKGVKYVYVRTFKKKKSCLCDSVSPCLYIFPLS